MAKLENFHLLDRNLSSSRSGSVGLQPPSEAGAARGRVLASSTFTYQQLTKNFSEQPQSERMQQWKKQWQRVGVLESRNSLHTQLLNQGFGPK